VVACPAPGGHHGSVRAWREPSSPAGVRQGNKKGPALAGPRVIGHVRATSARIALQNIARGRSIATPRSTIKGMLNLLSSARPATAGQAERVEQRRRRLEVLYHAEILRIDHSLQHATVNQAYGDRVKSVHDGMRAGRLWPRRAPTRRSTQRRRDFADGLKGAPVGIECRRIAPAAGAWRPPPAS